MSAVCFALLRHAATAWNEDGRLQGLTDIDLSPAGEAAARSWRLPAPADGWRRLASPLKRARRTAELIGPPATVTVEPRLREANLGTWEGRTVAALRAEGGDAFAANERLGLDMLRPGGETPRQTMERLAEWATEVARNGEPVVGVSHKGVVRAVLALATDWDMTSEPSPRLKDDCVHFFRAHPDGRVGLDRQNVPLRAATP